MPSEGKLDLWDVLEDTPQVMVMGTVRVEEQLLGYNMRGRG